VRQGREKEKEKEKKEGGGLHVSEGFSPILFLFLSYLC
jgi:hypothetical protein